MNTKEMKSKYKLVAEHELEEIVGMDSDTLVKELVRAKVNEEAAIKQKKEDEELIELTAEIKEFMQENLEKKTVELLEQVQAEKEAIKNEISDKYEDKKALNAGHNNLINGFRQKQKAVIDILRNRK